MVDSSSDRDPVEALADEFMARRRAGEDPSIDAYAGAHPDLAEEIRDLFPTLLMMEECKPAADSSADSADPAGAGAEPQIQRLGDFQILREIGRGGMGIVYEAEQLSLERHVALKVLPRQMLSGDLQIRRFEREARAAARLHHTNIVPVFGVGQDQGYYFYVMQFIRGHGLDKVVDELRRIKNPVGADSNASSTRSRHTPRHDDSADALARSLMTGTFSLAPVDEDSNSEDRDVVNHDEVEETIQRGHDETPEVHSRPRTPTGPIESLDTAGASDSNVLLGHPGTSNDQSSGPVSYWTSIARIGMQVAGALQHAHDQGVIHRDIKPRWETTGNRWTGWTAVDLESRRLELFVFAFGSESHPMEPDRCPDCRC